MNKINLQTFSLLVLINDHVNGDSKKIEKKSKETLFYLEELNKRAKKGQNYKILSRLKKTNKEHFKTLKSLFKQADTPDFLFEFFDLIKKESFPKVGTTTPIGIFFRECLLSWNFFMFEGASELLVSIENTLLQYKQEKKDNFNKKKQKQKEQEQEQENHKQKQKEQKEQKLVSNSEKIFSKFENSLLERSFDNVQEYLHYYFDNNISKQTTLSFATLNLARIYLEFGCVSLGLQALQESLKVAQSQKDLKALIQSLLMLAHIQTEQRQFQRAKQTLERCLTRARECNEPELEQLALLASARTELILNNSNSSNPNSNSNSIETHNRGRLNKSNKDSNLEKYQLDQKSNQIIELPQNYFSIQRLWQALERYYKSAQFSNLQSQNSQVSSFLVGAAAWKMLGNLSLHRLSLSSALEKINKKKKKKNANFKISSKKNTNTTLKIQDKESLNENQYVTKLKTNKTRLLNFSIEHILAHSQLAFHKMIKGKIESSFKLIKELSQLLKLESNFRIPKVAFQFLDLVKLILLMKYSILSGNYKFAKILISRFLENSSIINQTNNTNLNNFQYRSNSLTIGSELRFEIMVLSVNVFISESQFQLAQNRLEQIKLIFQINPKIISIYSTYYHFMMAKILEKSFPLNALTHLIQSKQFSQHLGLQILLPQIILLSAKIKLALGKTLSAIKIFQSNWHRLTNSNDILLAANAMCEYVYCLIQTNAINNKKNQTTALNCLKNAINCYTKIQNFNLVAKSASLLSALYHKFNQTQKRDFWAKEWKAANNRLQNRNHPFVYNLQQSTYSLEKLFQIVCHNLNI
ncbi:anaphase-promoting complex subunit 5 [Anaeramoeba flamelloides]|uniref:Anaphase-promoting complex subunit 5 n=1 Tax=Anaeramoeba flamelloides TaxID=1746091 RepID=A0ABQ8XCI6_9EUKA|nr:anaphase-promoting complex subunit 5 [Anaeramoeba flamelloides]